MLYLFQISLRYTLTAGHDRLKVVLLTAPEPRRYISAILRQVAFPTDTFLEMEKMS